MPIRPNSITPAIVESLYREALALAEDARSAFELSDALKTAAPSASLVASDARIALSCEALRTTTRMMHALAWLLNQRAFFAGELSEFQLRRHGHLPAAQPTSDPVELSLLAAGTAHVIEKTRAFYARIERLDQNWRAAGADEQGPVQNLRARIGQSYAVK